MLQQLFFHLHVALLLIPSPSHVLSFRLLFSSHFLVILLFLPLCCSEILLLLLLFRLCFVLVLASSSLSSSSFSPSIPLQTPPPSSHSFSLRRRQMTATGPHPAAATETLAGDSALATGALITVRDTRRPSRLPSADRRVASGTSDGANHAKRPHKSGRFCLISDRYVPYIIGRTLG